MLNLTPHDITLRTAAGDVTYPASGQLARVSTIATPTGAVVAGVPVVRNTYGPVTGLVRDDNGVPLPCIVSGMVLCFARVLDLSTHMIASWSRRSGGLTERRIVSLMSATVLFVGSCMYQECPVTPCT